MIALLIVYIASGLLMSGLALPLMWRKIPPNHWYGFRVRRTLEDEAVWYAANEFSARRLLRLGIATLSTGLVVQVPEYMEAGMIVKVDTRTGKYLSRA